MRGPTNGKSGVASSLRRAGGGRLVYSFDVDGEIQLRAGILENDLASLGERPGHADQPVVVPAEEPGDVSGRG